MISIKFPTYDSILFFYYLLKVCNVFTENSLQSIFSFMKLNFSKNCIFIVELFLFKSYVLILKMLNLKLKKIICIPKRSCIT